MRKLLILLALVLCVPAMGQLPPILRNIYTTNADLASIFVTDGGTGLVMQIDKPFVIPTSIVVSGLPRTNTLWVSQTMGHDTNALKNVESLPWQTIYAAMTNSSPGDHIRVLAGSYPEVIEILSNRNVWLDKDACVGDLGTTNRTGDATNWVWTLSGRGTITNLYLWSRNHLVASCWNVAGILSFGYEGAHDVIAEDTVGQINIGSVGTEPAGRYRVIARSILSGVGGNHVVNAENLARLQVHTRRQTNGFLINTAVADRSINCALVTDYINGNVTVQNSTIQPTTNRVTIGPASDRLTWTNGQLIVFSVSKSGTQPWATIQNTDWIIPIGSNGVYTPTTGSGQLHIRFRDVYANLPTITNGTDDFEIEANSTIYTSTAVTNWAQ